MRFRIRRYGNRWYVDDVRQGRTIVGVGPDARPSDSASLTPVEASAIARILNTLYESQS